MRPMSNIFLLICSFLGLNMSKVHLHSRLGQFRKLFYSFHTRCLLHNRCKNNLLDQLLMEGEVEDLLELLREVVEAAHQMEVVEAAHQMEVVEEHMLPMNTSFRLIRFQLNLGKMKARSHSKLVQF